MSNQFMSELVCGACETTGHVVWEGVSGPRRPVEISENVQLHDDLSGFTCVKCGTKQPLP